LARFALALGYCLEPRCGSLKLSWTILIKGKKFVNMTEPIRIHPDNPKLFEFRGQPIVLVTPTEHYGAVMNRPFRYERYLADAAEKGITASRLFVLFRELQSACNPYST
jgi:hypothetical protein